MMVSMTRQFYASGLAAFWLMGFSLGSFIGGNQSLAVVAILIASAIPPFVKSRLKFHD